MSRAIFTQIFLQRKVQSGVQNPNRVTFTSQKTQQEARQRKGRHRLKKGKGTHQSQSSALNADRK